MSRPLLKLESFETEGLFDDDAPLSPQDAEGLRARAFEDGYGAGWADALKQMRDEDALRRAASEEALQAVTFGFHEAKHGLEDCFVDLASQLLATLAPELRPIALQQHLARELRDLATRQFAGRLEILCAPASADAISDLVRATSKLDAAVIPEPSFTEAQILIRVDQTDRRIEMDQVLAVLHDAFITKGNKDIVHG